jgi:hypothetical protein
MRLSGTQMHSSTSNANDLGLKLRLRREGGYTELDSYWPLANAEPRAIDLSKGDFASRNEAGDGSAAENEPAAR